MVEPFSPRDLFERALRGWWLLVLGMLLGGGIAYLIHLSRPPVYEGRASIVVAIDLARTGSITQAEEDITIGAAGMILYMPPIPEQVTADARARNIDLGSYPDWQKVSLERRNYLWVLRIRFSNPQDAAELTNLWINRAYTQLLEAQKHADQAEGLRRSMESLESCLQNMAVVAPAPAQCAWPTQPEVQRELQAVSARYQVEKASSRGLIPALSISMGEKALPDPRPVTYDRNWMMLAGALIGLVAAVVLLASGVTDQLLPLQNQKHKRPAA